MLDATEFMTTTASLKVVLWIETIVYLSLGVYELLDDFLIKPKSWTKVAGQTNAWILMQEKIGHKMHAAICFLLGFVALNGIVEGQVTRFELELIFVSFALLSSVIFSVLPPGRLAIVTLLTKPEIVLQFVMFLLYVQLIRPEVVTLCALLNGWGLVVYVRQHRRSIEPFTYAEFRTHIAQAEGDELLARIDKAAGYQHDNTVDQRTNKA